MLKRYLGLAKAVSEVPKLTIKLSFSFTKKFDKRKKTTQVSIELGSFRSYTRSATTIATACFYSCCKNCSIYNQCVWAAVLQEFWLKFRQESSTPWHSKRCRRRTTWIRTILKRTPCSPRTGASYRANLARIRVEKPRSYVRAEKSADRWTDRQTAFRLYIVD